MGMGRRAFIGLVAGGAAGTLFTPLIWKSIDDVSIWSQNWSWIPRLQKGGLEYKPSLSKLDGNGAPVRIVTVDGRPVSVAGNAENPLSGGGVSALAGNEVSFLYSPARVKTPLKRTASGAFEAIGWDEAVAMVAGKLVEAKGKSAAISGDLTGSSTEILGSLLAKLGSDKLFLMPSEQGTFAAAWQGAMQGKGLPGYDIENADCVLIIGSDALQSTGTYTRNAKAFDKTHPIAQDATAAYYYAGPVKNRTAAVAGSWIPLAPGMEATFALGLAYHLIAMGKTTASADFGAFKTMVEADYAPAKVQALLGIESAAMAGIAKMLAAAKRPLVISGSAIGQGGSPAAAVAGLAVNLLLGNLNKPGGLVSLPELPAAVAGASSRSAVLKKDVVAWLTGVAQGKSEAPAVLLVHEANPAYALPQAEALKQAIGKAAFKVSFSAFMDETAALCDLILPGSLGLERADDMATPFGSGFASYSVALPVIEPVFGTRGAGDVLLAVAAKAGADTGFKTYADLLKAKVAKLAAMGGFLSTQKAPWEAVSGAAPALEGDAWKALTAGAAWVSVARVDESSVQMGAATLGKAAKPVAAELTLVPALDLNIGSAKVALPPQSVPTLRPNELGKGGMYVGISSATAGKLGLASDSAVKIESETGSLKALVRIDEGVMPGCVSAPLGFGHTAWDDFSKGKGENVYKLLVARDDVATGLPVWDSTAVKVAKI